MPLNFLSSLPEPVRRRWGNTIILGLGACVMLALWGTVVRVREGITEGRDAVHQSGERIAQALDQELAVYVSNLKGMGYLANRFLDGRTLGTENPVVRLVPVEGHDGYESVLPPAFGDLSTLGRITGAGAVPNLHDPVAAEMTMAVGLTPLMRAIKERSADVPWVQYVSARGFMFIFPAKGSEGFHFRTELLLRDYFAKASPKANPERSIFWSEPYEDAAGQGTIVTVTRPIDHDGRFIGSVSIDFKVGALTRYLQGMPIPQTHMRLVRAGDMALAHGLDEADDTQLLAHDVIRLALKNAPWMLELQVNPRELLLASLRARMWHVTTLLLSVLGFVFLLLLTRSYRKARDLAITDGLTGLYNRRHFETVAAHHFELARRGHVMLGLAILDIDFFKKYNDHYGHQQGDEALRAVSRALKQALRRGSDHVFRVGGEEFAILLPLRNAQELEPLMQHINQAVRDLVLPHAEHPAGHVTVSIGATAVSREHWTPVDTAYKAADDLLYEAKQGGRDRAKVQQQP